LSSYDSLFIGVINQIKDERPNSKNLGHKNNLHSGFDIHDAEWKAFSVSNNENKLTSNSEIVYFFTFLQSGTSILCGNFRAVVP